ncbi:hypothetical protein GCM10010331_71390 [Streptomyces xanthochromogenes]|uniref:hypothetical protein n=1 Tax=Streptomyces xanthochromogenes TaxID=67384 RepID=UPI001675044A|nr:hypothetical protein [Streptomyces xanthochromogenes]GHB73156.1 hypothetical protein GCM10010331_71390 [Streptomyces xanthochromogenes]
MTHESRDRSPAEDGQRADGTNRSPRPLTLPVQSRVRGVLLRLTGGLLVTVGIITEVIGFGRFQAMTRYHIGTHPWWATFVVTAVMAVGGFVIYAGRLLQRDGRRHSTKVIDPSATAELGEFVLYLRSFDDDVDRAQLESSITQGIASTVGDVVLSGKTEEEQLIAALRPAGRVVAAGQPGQVLPPAGADRFFMADDNWQQTILDLMIRARLVVIAAGGGQAVLWELTQAFRYLTPPQRLVLLIPMEPQAYNTFRDRVSAALRQEVEHVRAETGREWLPPELPDYPPGDTRSWNSTVKGLILFDEGWRPHFSRLGVPRAGLSRPRRQVYFSVRRVLHPVFTQLGIHPGGSSAPRAPGPGRGRRQP